ncbi:MAG: hypothetical protein GY938_07450, partial [Ketobacter sp.]|nr:hypothetical protein [Ketobacter sp.]
MVRTTRQRNSVEESEMIRLHSEGKSPTEISSMGEEEEEEEEEIDEMGDSGDEQMSEKTLPRPPISPRKTRETPKAKKGCCESEQLENDPSLFPPALRSRPPPPRRVQGRFSEEEKNILNLFGNGEHPDDVDWNTLANRLKRNPKSLENAYLRTFPFANFPGHTRSRRVRTLTFQPSVPFEERLETSKERAKWTKEEIEDLEDAVGFTKEEDVDWLKIAVKQIKSKLPDECKKKYMSTHKCFSRMGKNQDERRVRVRRDPLVPFSEEDIDEDPSVACEKTYMRQQSLESRNVRMESRGNGSSACSEEEQEELVRTTRQRNSVEESE